MINTPKYNTNNITLEILSNKSNRYSLNLFNNSYSYLEIEIKPVDKNSNSIYAKKFSLDEIKKLRKYFLICESLEDVICSIKPTIDKSNLIEKNREIELLIPINHPLCKEALFEIPQKAKEVTNSINELYNSINDLKYIINDQQEIISKQQKEINELKKRIEILENSKKENIKENNGLNDSLIISNDKKTRMSIKNWIDKNQKIKFELIFRKSRDGQNCHDFHRYCDNQGATLCIIQTTKKYKFGAYSSIPWQSSFKLSKENEGNVFLFSLDLNRKFDKIKEGTVQFSDSDFGPCFGDNGGCLYLQADLNDGCIQNSNFLTNCELTHGEEKDFKVEEFEVFKVESILELKFNH